MTTAPDAQTTRQRLLHAAAEIFDKQGFAGASVRDICTLAEANVAAINYHFGGKEQLFAEVLRLPLQQIEASIPGFSAPDLSLFEALRRMYRGMLAPLRCGSAEAAAMRLVARSFATHGAGGVRPDKSVIQRHHSALIALVRAQLPKKTADAVVGAVCGALVGMAMHAVMGQLREGPEPRMWSGGDDRAVDALADRLARYAQAVIATEAKS